MRLLARDLRYASRTLARAPGFSLAVVLTFAIGIGANSAVFSALDAVLLKPLSFPDSERLVRLTETRDRPGVGVGSVRARDWDRESSTFEAISAYATFDASDTTAGVPERVRAAGVAPRFLKVWGVSPALGRDFSEAEYRSGEQCARLVSDRYWRTRLGSDPAVVGRSMRLNDVSCTIVGVMPASFRFPDVDVDVWTAEAIDAPWLNRRAYLSYLTGVGRLKPGVTVTQARADLDALQARLAEEFPETDRGITVAVTPLKDVVVGNAPRTLWLLFGAVSLLLMIACTNVVSLLLARASRRQAEIQIRASLGATRSALVAQMSIEAVVLAAIGGGIGLVIATGTAAAFQTLAPTFPRLQEAGIDWRMLSYGFALTLLVALSSGLFAALRSLPAGNASSRLVPATPRLQWTLVGVQVALSVTLLAGAGLLLRTVDALADVDAGFDARSVLAFRMSQVYDVPRERAPPIVTGWLEQLAALPGVQSASAALSPPGTPNEALVEVESNDPLIPREAAESRLVSSDYFATMAIDMLSGTSCRLGTAGAPAEAVVNRRFTERHLAGRSALGAEIRLRDQGAAGAATVYRIVGVVDNTRERGLHLEPVATVYRCVILDTNPWVLLRTRGEPSAAITSVRGKMQELAPLRSVYPIAPLEDQIASGRAPDRLRTILLASFAATALLLASLGIYGTLSYVASLRGREVGLRMALGAMRANITARFVTQALRVVAIGCVAGLLVSLASSRLLSGMLFGVSPTDPLTLVAVVGLVFSVATLAALFPSLRAARRDPLEALREE